MSNDFAIKIDNLSKKFILRHSILNAEGINTNELWALKNVSFELKKGQSVGIIGSNGSGKSTLLKILAGITTPTIGRVEINGRVASILDIGAGFHPDQTGRENVFLNGQLLGFNRKEIQDKFNEIVAFSGIEKYIEEPVKNYSNGMYLRLAFSIMAHLDFDIYLFDEVMRVGDAEFAFKTRNKLNELLSLKKTLLFVSHNIEELYNLDTFVLLEGGLLKEMSNKKNILLNYVEKNAGRFNIEITTKPIKLFDFSKYPYSKDVIVKSINFFQDDTNAGEIFRTDKSFLIELEYEKINDEDTIDIVLCISDIQDNIILSSSPFVSQNFSETTKNEIRICKCTIPPHIFNSQVYKISFFFLKNINKTISETYNNINYSSTNGYTIEKALKLSNVIVFKPVFYKDSKAIDLSSIDISGHLLCGFDWV